MHRPSYPHFLGLSNPENLVRLQLGIVFLSAIPARDEYVPLGICHHDPMKPEAKISPC